jgi:hypothetical protein
MVINNARITLQLVKDRTRNNFRFIAFSLGLDLNVLIEQKRRNIGYLSNF